jgi:hypothetical protein
MYKYDGIQNNEHLAYIVRKEGGEEFREEGQ